MTLKAMKLRPDGYHTPQYERFLSLRTKGGKRIAEAWFRAKPEERTEFLDSLFIVNLLDVMPAEIQRTIRDILT